MIASRSAGWRLSLASALVVLLSGCGSGDADPGAESSQGPEAGGGQSEAPAPPGPTTEVSETAPATESATAPGADPAASSPRGVYDVSRTIAAVTQTNPETTTGSVGETDIFTLDVAAGTCGASGCTSKARSSGGKVYSFTWNGQELAVARKSDVEDLACGGGQGTVQSRHTFTFTSARVSGPPDARPSSISFTMTDVSRLLRSTASADCDLSSAGDVTYTLDLVLSAR